MSWRVCGEAWPIMCRRRVFPGTSEQVRAARDFIRSLLADHSCADDILLVVSELVSNATRHSRSGLPGGLVVIEVRRWRRWLAVAVIDQGGPSEPVMRPPADPLSEGGRGLPTVDACARWWCWRGDTRGRTVTAFFRE
ncbi:MAG TPA: ATP-binding protein [Streptosporangiaceae bacterium]|nr:ATP-binding protein [Streptosporangiaceae bacterium]